MNNTCRFYYEHKDFDSKYYLDFPYFRLITYKYLLTYWVLPIESYVLGGIMSYFTQ